MARRSLIALLAAFAFASAEKWLPLTETQRKFLEGNSQFGYPLQIRQLLAEKADITQLLTESGETALHLAAARGNVDVLKVLLLHWLQRGLSVDEVDTTLDMTPLHRAIDGSHDEAVRLLIEMGANVQAEDHEGSQPIHYAAGAATKAPTKKIVSIINQLIEQGADVEAINYEQNRPVHVAASRKCFACMEELLRHGIDVNARNSYKQTAMHLAAAEDNARGYEQLLNAGANPNVKDEEGRKVEDYAKKPNIKNTIAKAKQDRAAAKLEKAKESKGPKKTDAQSSPTPNRDEL